MHVYISLFRLKTWFAYILRTMCAATSTKIPTGRQSTPQGQQNYHIADLCAAMKIEHNV